jgi:hypothetical protein
MAGDLNKSTIFQGQFVYEETHQAKEQNCRRRPPNER